MPCLPAIYKDKCSYCGEAILVGDMICVNEMGDWVHKQCYEEELNEALR